MKIAIHTADLDHDRVDGTRVYMLNVLKFLGKIFPRNDFFLYHKRMFNAQLTPPHFSNYVIQKITFPFLWTQIAFAWKIFCDKPDVLWMPMHNLPIVRRKGLKTVVTIHDLAFKRFPEYFPKRDLRRLHVLSALAIRQADRIIAISESTKHDIVHFFPDIRSEKIFVVHHGFDADLFSKKIPPSDSEKILEKYDLKPGGYVLYVGAIQPRKNIGVLIEAFEKLHEENTDLKLVLAGEKAWMWEGILEKIQQSSANQSIVLTGRVSFSELPVLYQNAGVFAFPSLYEGFGIPILEAFASGVPVVAARNSSLVEVGGEAAEYFEGDDANDLYEKVQRILRNTSLSEERIARGRERVKLFSWEKCAAETADALTNW